MNIVHSDKRRIGINEIKIAAHNFPVIHPLLDGLSGSTAGIIIRYYTENCLVTQNVKIGVYWTKTKSFEKTLKVI